MDYLYRLAAATILFSIFSLQANAQKMSRQEYIERYKELAIKEMNEFRIPASITLAQACLESADGNSKLAVEANNHFGIKCSNWTGDTIYHHDDKKNECFRKYKNVEQSFTDHSIFLTKARYAQLFKLDPTDYKSWAKGLSEAGYATNPRYAEHLIKIIEDFSLYRFDSPDTYKVVADNTKNNISERVSPVDSTYNAGFEFSIDRSDNKINGKRYIIAGNNDSYESIASEFNLFHKEILRFNDLESDESLTPGTIVFIEKKGKKGSKDNPTYTVGNEKSYREIAQKTGIRLKNLLKLNSLTETSTPVGGKKIKLR